MAHFFLTELYSQLGQENEAQAEAAESMRRNPDLTLEVFKQGSPLKDQAELDHMIDNLRKAGLK